MLQELTIGMSNNLKLEWKIIVRFEGETIEMSSSEGTFDTARIDLCQNLVLIAAGTGLTPMIRILNYVIQRMTEKKDIRVFLLFFNKTRNDLLCQEELQTLSDQHK